MDDNIALYAHPFLCVAWMFISAAVGVVRSGRAKIEDSVNLDVFHALNLARDLLNSKEISSPPQILPASSLCCISCGSTVGEEHTSLQGLEFFKASVSVSQKAYSSTSSTHVDKELLESYPPEVIVGFQLLECIERSGARKFVMHSGIENNQQKDGLLVWVFNTDVRYSYNSSASCGNLIISAKRALKVFYQHLDNVQPLVNPEFGLLSATSLEEIRLPPRLYDCIKGSLERSTGLLPPSGRKFKESLTISAHYHRPILQLSSKWLAVSQPYGANSDWLVYR
ncbi:conserved hypothetical protein [Microsporum canis CBS 113480]|uniref:Uncharacterized protein n=1 Tax=Arthroderma otae (strain ATCC MYA-4605 / CBS 113480) TaxID=554155 RepID=C5FYZ5_ARTOC|nr:conserved hypothetical protein [Microsporum canis CBS 113480]EEQ34743.1 conserved hypothetical protein [Microsporum canis CBS 113480]